MTFDQDINTLFGENLDLEQGGANAEEQEARDKANEMLDEAGSLGLNARRMMLQKKKAFASGECPQIPTQEEILAHIQQSQQQGKVEAFGDGSLTNPTEWGPPWVVSVFILGGSWTFPVCTLGPSVSRECPTPQHFLGLHILHTNCSLGGGRRINHESQPARTLFG